MTWLLPAPQAPHASHPWSSVPLHFQNVFSLLPLLIGSFLFISTVLIKTPLVASDKTQLKIAWDKIRIYHQANVLSHELQ